MSKKSNAILAKNVTSKSNAIGKKVTPKVFAKKVTLFVKKVT